MVIAAAPEITDAASVRCPHVIFREVLGAGGVARLMDYVAEHESDFQSSRVRNRSSGQTRIDYNKRSNVTTTELGPFVAPFDAFVRKIAATALARLHVEDAELVPKEFQINAYRDGDKFRAHIDTSDRMTKIRVLSCVYYFAATPRRFNGGLLRLYAMPTLSVAKSGDTSFVDVPPDTDTMIVFPSWLRHEVLPVDVPTGAWLDSRFTINCWLHRPA